ncbi:MAG: glyoxalase/Bleomycin resistance/Dioxygenase superfamily protein [Acidobacteriaceae bacterium]|nr:glyoxalase/Bleomycin resistance/Dioxygenase superfamily protein [Acidobacteriaceae bacterium]
MPYKAGYATPMLHVVDLERSIHFYELLGFTTIDTDRCTPLGWARLHCEGGAVAFLRAEHAIDPTRQSFLLYLYTPDLVALREHLLANQVTTGEIKHPHYMPSGMVNFRDPDGYIIEIGHWGKTEQDAWQKRLNIPLEERT